MQKNYYAITPSFSTVTRYVNEGDYNRIYDLVEDITNDALLAAAASSWCELATVGELYEHDLFTILIIDDNE